MNLSDEQKRQFVGEVNKVLSNEIAIVAVSYEGTPDEMREWLRSQLGEENMQKLFLLVTTKDKKDWPDQSADVITSVTVTLQENKPSI